MLHLTARRAGALAGYAGLLAGAAALYAVAGPRPFASDAGLAQRLAAALFALAGAAAYRLPRLPFGVRALLAAGCAWVAVDEALLVHECLKFGALAHAAGGALRDAPVVACAVAGAAAALAAARRVAPPPAALAHGAVAAAAVATALLLDVGGLARGPVAEAVEETAELVAAWASIQCFAAAGEGRASARWPEALGVAAWLTAALGAAVWLVRPLFCAPRFLGG